MEQRWLTIAQSAVSGRFWQQLLSSHLPLGSHTNADMTPLCSALGSSYIACTMSKRHWGAPFWSPGSSHAHKQIDRPEALYSKVTLQG